MTTRNAMTAVPPTPPEAPVRRVPNAVLGMVLFVAAEIMFFGALISAHTISRAAAPGGVWPPDGQPRLPARQTAFHTALLLASAPLLWAAGRATRSHPTRAGRYLLGAILLGAAFVALQGREWVALLREGLTLRSSTHGGFFYLIIGAHGLHAVAALLFLAWIYRGFRRGEFSPHRFWAARVLWNFVVLVWPTLYARVYL